MEKIEEIKQNHSSILDKLDNLKINKKNIIEEEWNKKEQKKHDMNLLFAEADEDIEDGEYNEAINKLKNISVWNKDRSIKYQCNYKIGFCYYKIALDFEGYIKAIKWFKKAEKSCDVGQDDSVLLYRNLGNLYILLGEQKNKVENYGISIDYFIKALISIEEVDIFYKKYVF